MESPKELVESLTRLFERITAATMHILGRFTRGKGMQPWQLFSLMRIERGSRRGIMHMGRDINVTGSAMSQMVARLVAQGYVTRNEDPEDRRTKRLDVTSLGLEVIADSREAQSVWIRDLASRLSAEEAQTMMVASGILLARIDEMRASANTDQSEAPMKEHHKR